MIVIAIELLAVWLISNKLLKAGLRIRNVLIVSVILQVLILTLYRIELFSLGRNVYYSDAEVYWNDALKILDGNSLQGTQVGYAYFCALIQITSPIKSVLLNNVSNLLLIDLSLLLISDQMLKHNVCKHNILSFLWICACNPLVIYSLQRNLKDALFIFLAVCIVVLYLQILKGFNFLLLLSILLLSFVISTVRPWGFIIIFLLVFERLFSKKNLWRNVLVFVAGLSIFFGLFYFAGYRQFIDVWAPEVIGSAGKQTVLGLLSAPLRILTGPGPVRAFMGAKYFMFYTITGNVASAIGAVMWWWELSCFFTNIRKCRLSPIAICFSVVTLFFLFVYSLQYGGSLELRFRGVIYILFSSSLICLFREKRLIRTFNIPNAVAFSFLAIVGTVVSLV